MINNEQDPLDKRIDSIVYAIEAMPEVGKNGRPNVVMLTRDSGAELLAQFRAYRAFAREAARDNNVPDMLTHLDDMDERLSTVLNLGKLGFNDLTDAENN